MSVRLGVTRLLNRILGPAAPVRCGYSFFAPAAARASHLQECARPRGHATEDVTGGHCHHPPDATRATMDGAGWAYDAWTFCVRCTAYWPHDNPLKEAAPPWGREAADAGR